MTMLTDRERDILAAIQKGLNGNMGADRIAARLGYRPARSGRLSVSSTLRSLHSRGLVGRIPPQDQWGHAIWYVTDAGRAALSPEGH